MYCEMTQSQHRPVEQWVISGVCTEMIVGSIVNMAFSFFSNYFIVLVRLRHHKHSISFIQ